MMHLARDGKRDMVNLTIYKKIKEANAVTTKGLQREIAKVKKDVKTMRMGPLPDTSDEMKSFTEEEQRHHIRSNHAVYDKRCELCVQTRGLSRHPKGVEAETVNFGYATVQSTTTEHVHTLLVGGVRGARLLRDEFHGRVRNSTTWRDS